MVGPLGLELNSNMKKLISQRKLEANRKNSVLGSQATKDKFLQPYLASPNHCKMCGTMLPFEKKKNAFCSKSCAATFNNTGRVRVPKYEKVPCQHCGTLVSHNKKYCSITCSSTSRTKYTPKEAEQVRKNRTREASAAYRAKLRNQTPPDADRKAIAEFYANCQKGYEVDHIIPISKGGLHTLSNLQYLTITENRKKGSKMVPAEGFEPPILRL
ncbi:HNH endonuclease [bacterium]|nr:HNH endonuclease [bacterium]